jgi:hypothetical protein
MSQHRLSKCWKDISCPGRRFGLLVVAAVFVVFGVVPKAALADEGGVSFWLPGLFGSLAAVPSVPGFTFYTFDYYTTVTAGAGVAAAREYTIGGFKVPVKVSLSASLKADAGFGWFDPIYVFATPVLGGQVSVGMAGILGGAYTSVSGLLTGSIGPIPVSKSGSISNSVAGYGDLYPQAFWKWNQGVNNFMIYATGDVPVGIYSSTSLANLGIGHGTIDSGAGYTYLDPTTGHEFSAVGGFTYNFMNPSTDYQNGVDFHLDWGASQFLSKQLLVGAVGYLYDEVGCDSGYGDRVGCFQSRVVGVGPQIGYMIPMGNMQGYLNLKAYGEFDAHARPSGANVWLSFVISPAMPTPPASKPM